MWHIPGGTVYRGEKLEEAVHRIADGELGVKVNIKNMIGVIEYPRTCEKKLRHAVWVAFLCELKPEGQKFRGSFQAEEIEAFKIIPDNTVQEQKAFLESMVRL